MPHVKQRHSIFIAFRKAFCNLLIHIDHFFVRREGISEWKSCQRREICMKLTCSSRNVSIRVILISSLPSLKNGMLSVSKTSLSPILPGRYYLPHHIFFRSSMRSTSQREEKVIEGQLAPQQDKGRESGIYHPVFLVQLFGLYPPPLPPLCGSILFTALGSSLALHPGPNSSSFFRISSSFSLRAFVFK